MFCEVSGDFVIGISSASALNEDEGEGCSGSYQVDPNSLPFTLRRVDRQWEVKCSADEFSLFPDQITSTALADGERPASKVLAFLRQFEKQNEQKAKIASSRAKIVEQLNKIGWNRVSSCNEDLRSVSFMFTDCDQRQIWLEMKLSLDDFPASPPVCSGNFPGQFEFFWDGCVREIYMLYRGWE
uniref:FANCL UBC-like domain-containing protein n=1 Tax=Plectus sambesii TaxID=2011161 RepID=A0A914X9F6_9BILA